MTTNMSFNERIRKLCRVCGDMGSINIFGSIGQSLDLSEKINMLLPINIELNDNFSTMTCDACVSQIIAMDYIVEIGIKTNDLMIKILEKNETTFRERMMELCRICGNPGILDIFNQFNDDSVSLAEKINSFLTFQVNPDDQLSLKICQNCIDQIENVYPLIEFSLNTTKLMSMIVEKIPQDTMAIEVVSSNEMDFEINEIIIQENKENELNNFKEELLALTSHDNSENTNKKPQCLRCTDIFTSGKALRRHILLNHNLKELDCHHCFRRCASVMEFENHVKLHFTAENPYFPCDLCFLYFNSLANLIYHIKTHNVPCTKDWALVYDSSNDSDFFGCRYCNKIFLLKASKQIHERTHYTYLICEICGKQLPNKYQLGVHQRQHSGERPYECTNCGSSFKCLSTLRQHEVVHSEKKYSCEVCLRKFSRPEKVRIHMRVHTGEKPYNCLRCHKKYQQKNDLNRHVKKKHSDHNTIRHFR